MTETICTYNDVEFTRIVGHIPRSVPLIDYGRIISAKFLWDSKQIYISTAQRVAFYWHLSKYHKSLGSRDWLHMVRIRDTDQWLVLDGYVLAKLKDELTNSGRLRTLILENSNGVRILEPLDHERHHPVENAFCPDGRLLRVAAQVYQPDHRPGNPILEGDMGAYAYRFDELVLGNQPPNSGRSHR